MSGSYEAAIKRATGPYQAALIRAKKQGPGACDDAAAMAHYCQTILQIMVGAVSPQLVWEGAQARRLTSLELAAMALRGVEEIDELQWGHHELRR